MSGLLAGLLAGAVFSYPSCLDCEMYKRKTCQECGKLKGSRMFYKEIEQL